MELHRPGARALSECNATLLPPCHAGHYLPFGNPGPCPGSPKRSPKRSPRGPARPGSAVQSGPASCSFRFRARLAHALRPRRSPAPSTTDASPSCFYYGPASPLPIHPTVSLSPPPFDLASFAPLFRLTLLPSFIRFLFNGGVGRRAGGRWCGLPRGHHWHGLGVTAAVSAQSRRRLGNQPGPRRRLRSRPASPASTNNHSSA
jgi:hypothetical protein